MKNKHLVWAIGLLLLAACGTKNPITGNSQNYTHCDVQENFCIQYPKTIFPAPEEGLDKDDLMLGLYSKDYDIRLLVAADKNAENLTFEQLYEHQLTLWEETYDDVDVDESNITGGGYEVSASGEGYYLYAKAARYIRNGDIISIRLVGGPEINPILFADLKKEILLYPNK